MGSLQTNGTSYVLVNSGKEAQTRFAALSAIYDCGTVRHLEGLGVGSGWHCLEIGGGSGTIAKWLADRVGSTGHVLATDLDTRFLEPLKGPNLEVCRHNIGTDPLPKAAFDLIHTRLVLMHVPERDAALARMMSSLKVGGWLLVEEYDSCSVLPDPTLSSGETLLQTHRRNAKTLGRWRRESSVWTIAFRVTARRRIDQRGRIGAIIHVAKRISWYSDDAGELRTAPRSDDRG